MQPIFTETHNIGKIFASTKTRHDWIFKYNQDTITTTLKLSHNSHKLEFSVNGKIMKSEKERNLDELFPLKFSVDKLSLELRKNGRKVDLYHEGESFDQIKKIGSQRGLLQVDKKFDSQWGILQADKGFDSQRGILQVDKNSGLSNLTKDESGSGGQPIKMGRSGQLEKMADNFLEVDFPVGTLSKSVYYSIVHEERGGLFKL